MEPFKFKRLEMKQEGSWLKRLVTSTHFKKTVLYTLAGAFIGYVLFIIEQDAAKLIFWSNTAMQNVLMGMAFGVFITNSPCARGKC